MGITRSIIFAQVALLAGCADARSIRPAGAERADATPQAVVQIELQPYRTRLRTVTAKVGAETGRFLLDTAGGLSMLTPEFAQKVRCEPWGRVTGFRMMGERLDAQQCPEVKFELKGVTLRAPLVGVLDLMSFFPKDAEKVDGLIALDVFAGQAITLDLGNSRITVESPQSLAARTRAMREGQVRIGREVQGAALSVQAAARSAKGLVWFELDSGNGGSLLMSRHVAPLFGLDPKVESSQPARFDLIGPATVEGSVFVPDMIIDGNLGMPFLSRWVVTLDLSASRMWLAPTNEQR